MNTLVSITSLLVICLLLCTVQSYEDSCDYSCSQRANTLARKWRPSLAWKYYTFCVQRCRSQPGIITTRTTRRMTQPPTPTPIWRTTTQFPTIQTCGVSGVTNRIVGGDQAAECQFPWMAAVNADKWFCGGTIIDNWHILSAAHCFRRHSGYIVAPSDVRVRVGSSRLKNMVFRRINSYQIHRRHTRSMNDYDVAVITLQEPLVYSRCIRPICLPDVNTPEVSTSDTCFAAGWGTRTFFSSTVTPDLQMVNLPLSDQRECEKAYNLYSNVINPLKLCAGNFSQGGQDACKGDSGGPYMCYRHGVFYQFGIVSFGQQCALPYHPGVYARVQHPDILSFIQTAQGRQPGR